MAQKTKAAARRARSARVKRSEIDRLTQENERLQRGRIGDAETIGRLMSEASVANAKIERLEQLADKAMAGGAGEPVPGVLTETTFDRGAQFTCFKAGWDAAKRDSAALDEHDVADAPDVAFQDWLGQE